MENIPANPTLILPVPSLTSGVRPHPGGLEADVVALFDEFRAPLLRYVLSFGLSVHDSEDVIQEVFLCLHKHLLARKSRANLRGWIFRVAHNLSLKRRIADQKQFRQREGTELTDVRFDPAPSAEDQMLQTESRMGLMAVVRALPEQDQQCLRLRAEGLRYREIAEVLDMSLGAVSISLTRSLARLERSHAR